MGNFEKTKEKNETCVNGMNFEALIRSTWVEIEAYNSHTL